ncbi:MAG TPA: helix-turn-helix domain-containing protein [Chloroflexota bacterium]|nr:helix-turn-helix domain-containing protein [Chloroflexota bacterium]
MRQGEGPDSRSRESFAAQLRRHRIAAGLSQEALAERAGLSPGAINLLERGARRAPYEATVRVLADSLGLTGADREAFEAAVVRSRRPRQVAARPDGLVPAAAQLPTPITPLVGRERELDDVVQLLDRPDVRLLSLLGPPGVGKTRLALAAAARSAVERRQPAAFVRLDAVLAAADVLGEVASVLGVESDDAPPLELLVDRFGGDRRLILVLDTCEHVAAGGPDVAALLERCRGLQVLATSRAPLRVRGEWRYRLAPLPLPDGAWLATPAVRLERRSREELAANRAVALFVRRATEHRADFALTDENAPAVAALIARLGGLPLAVELAAEHAAALTPEAVLARWDAGQPLPGEGPRDLPPRNRMLDATTAWSYDLLTPDEQRLFRRLSVLGERFTLEMAAAVAVEPGPDGDEALLDRLLGLVEQGLLLEEEPAAQQASFRLLGLFQRFGARLAAEHGEVDELRGRLVAALFRLAEAAAPALSGPDQAAWAARLDAWAPQVDAVLAWLDAAGDAARTGELLYHLWRWFAGRAPLSASAWAERLLRRSTALDRPQRGRVLFVAGASSLVAGDAARARVALEESAAIQREEGGPGELGRTLAWLALARSASAPSEDDRTLVGEAMSLRRAAGDPLGTAEAALFMGAVAARLGRLDEAGALLREGTALGEALGDAEMAGLGLLWLGTLHLVRGEASTARTLLERGQAAHGRSGAVRLLGWIAALLGLSASQAGEMDQAARDWAEALRLARRHGDARAAVLGLAGMASIAAARGRRPRAQLLAAAAAALRELVPGPDPFRGFVQDDLAPAAGVPTAQTAPPFDEAIDEALQEAPGT